MISAPYKIQYEEAKKNFSFRPNNEIKKENIKLKPIITDKVNIKKYLNFHKEKHEKYKKNKIIISSENSNLNNDGLHIDKRCFSENKKSLNKNYSTNLEKYLQPIMKFKPRTDLERIFDTINLNYYGKIDRYLVNEQLKSLGLVTVYNKKNPKLQTEYSLLKEKLKVNPETLRYLIKEKQRLEQGPKTNKIKELISNMDNIIHINKEIISKRNQKNFSYSGEKAKNHRIKRRNMNNFLAKNILSEYQRKTHFKALLNCTLNLEKSNKKYKSLSNNTKTHFSTEHYNDNKSSTINTYKNFKTMINKTCFKPFHSKKNYPKEDMEYLKKLCNMTHNEYFRAKNQIDINRTQGEEGDEEPNKYLKHANTVLINGKPYNKKDLPTLTKVILKECNYIKNYYDKESAGDGKTMITRGLSVNEFTKKYRLPK